MVPPSSKKVFVLDTNVLLHDPMSIRHFQEHDIVIPIVVIEEIDTFKKDQTEIGRNARSVSRQLDKLRPGGSLSQGVAMEGGGTLKVDVAPASPGPGPGGPGQAQGRQPDPGLRPGPAEGPQGEGGDGVQGHQPAHQGRRPGPPGRGLHHGPGGGGRALHRHRRLGGGPGEAGHALRRRAGLPDPERASTPTSSSPWWTDQRHPHRPGALLRRRRPHPSPASGWRCLPGA